MEKKKLKKLTINKMNEFPKIAENEQKIIIGGGVDWSTMSNNQRHSILWIPIEMVAL